MQEDDEDFNFEEFEYIFNTQEGLGDELLNFSEEAEDPVWHPRFPVDLENPVELTELQKERALKIFDSVDDFMVANPDEETPPLICITQDWRVRTDYGGWNSDSDFRESVLCVMCRDEEGFYLDLDYVEQCVPYIENELRENAEKCMEMYGEVPDHHEEEKKRVVTAEMALLSLLSDDNLREFGYNNVLIAMDTIEGSIYPIPADMDHDDYGGIIDYIPANTLVNEDGSIKVDKVKKLINDFLNPI